MNMKKTVLGAAMATAMGVSGTAAADTIVTFDWTGWFTMLNTSGQYVSNTDFANDPPYYGDRTAVAGTMTFNLDTGFGTGTVDAFSFFGSGAAVATTITMQAIGDGFGNAGPLVLANMGFNWNTNSGIPVSLVLDATGMFGAVQAGLTVGQVIDDVGVYAESEDTVGGSARTGTWLNPMGLMPVATTAWNTTPLCTTVNPGDGSCLGTNPSGDLPLITDTVTDATNGDIGIGGSPMIDGPFTGYNANFDVDVLTVTSITTTSPVPVPAAVWLFGSGLVGLVGVARRRKSS